MARGAAKLGRSVLDLDVEDGKFTAGLDRNRRKAMSWTDTLGRDVKRGIGQGIGISAGLGVASAVSAGIEGVKAVVAGSISAAIEWESAFAGVRKTVDASPAEFADLERSIRDMALEMPIAATELAGLAEAAGALGIAKGDIEEFTRVTAMIGTTTDVSASDAATSLGQLSNVLGLTADDYERFGSTLVDLGNKGASTESQILGIASRAGAGSKLISMATDETLAWSSAVANLGIEVEAGGSALQTFFLQSAKSVATGTEKLEKYASVAGMTGAEFKRAFEKDASGALQTFLAALGELSQGEQLKALSDLGFKDVRISRMLLGLAGNVDNITGSLETASVAWEANTALVAEAETRYGTTESKMAILGNRVNELAISFGDELLPSLVSLATFGVEQLEQFAGEAGQTATEVGGAMQYLAGHFGEMGDATNKLADDMDQDFMQVNDAVVAYMSETGASFEAALEAVRLYGTGNTAALEQSGRDWEAYQKQVAPTLRAVVADVDAGVAGTEAALLAGEGPIGEAADALEQAISKEAQEARDKSLAAMKEMLTGMTNLFVAEEDLPAAWQELIDRLDDPYTEAERLADVFSQNTIDNIRTVIQAGDPGATADMATLVNNMLAQTALLAPGALEDGTAVPPALQAGMDSQMGALITFLQTQNGIIIGELTLDEAKGLGLDGIWQYAQGMRERAEEAKRTAAAISLAAVIALNRDASAGGSSIITTWLDGMTGAYAMQGWKIQGIVGHVAQIVGTSLPSAGPLQHPDSGGLSIGETWIDGIVRSVQAGIGAVESVAGSVGGAMNVEALIPAPQLPGASAAMSAGATMGSMSGGNVQSLTQQWILNVEGVPRVIGSKQQAIEELERIGATWG